MNRVLVRIIPALLSMLFTAAVMAQSVVRGPYLQQQSENSIIVRWRTDVATDSVVRYGLDSASLGATAAVGGARTEHSVQLTGLSPVTQYFYSVGDSLATLAGDSSYFFSTAPVTGTAVPTRFWVLGDSGTANADARAVRDAFKAWSASSLADFVVFLGDNAYNDGTDAQYQAAVFDTYPELLRQLPAWPTLGNHDGFSADSATQSGPYNDIFELPAAGEVGGLASGTEAYYSFDYGEIHFISLDSYETDRSTGGNMLQWLEGDLAFNDKPWVIAFWHHPPYSKGSHDSDTEGRLIDMRQNVLPILEAWGADLVMSGHSHSYERSYLLDGHYGLSTTLDPVVNVLNPGDGRESGDGVYAKPNLVAAEHAGAVYAVAGSSGKVSSNPALDHPAMFVSLASLGSMVIDVAGNRLDAVFIDQTGLVLDAFTLMKTPDLQAPMIADARAQDGTHVIVDYTERVDVSTATNAANYAIPGLSISTAAMLAGNKSVRLTTSVMTPGASYVLSVNNVMDESANTILPNSQFSFSFVQQLTVSFQDGLAPTPAYDGTFDAYIREASATSNYGAATTLQVDGDEPAGAGTDMNIVIGWDVSDIPPTAVVDAASIHFNTLNAGGPYNCFALLSAWNQAEVNWIEAGIGFAWQNPGAGGVSDRDSLVLCTFNAGSTGPIAINLNADGLALVQSWVNGSAANNGIIISDSVSANGADFDSSESSTAMARPRLEVGYTVPANPASPPLAPTGLAAAVFSSNRIDLNWSDNSADETGFKVERSPDGTNTWTQIADLPADSTAYQNSALAAGATYFYRVFAYNANGNSANSNIASATTFTVPRSIQFSGRSWTVKASGSPVGPGPNYFSDTADDVWVDASGALHLRIAFSNGNWRSSEVISDDVLGYGTYTFTLGSRVDLLDRNIVVGLFTWDSFAPQFNYREIDIEFARWGNPLTGNSQYVVQPWDNAGNTFRWETSLTANDSTHAFNWRPDRVEFSSYQGSPPGAAIQSWTYSGPDVPPPGTTSGNARINFWLNGGSAPFDGQEAELLIKSFDFTPPPFSDNFAIADIFGAGTVTGIYTATYADDGSTQSIRERESGGKKQNRYSYLVHTWQFNLPANAMATLYANAWSGASSDDNFSFSWSTDNSSYSDLLTINSTNPANVASAIIPANVSGTFYIRLRDTDQTAGNRTLDTFFVDQLFIRTDSAGGDPPAAPTALAASVAGSDRINLAWTDNATDEAGFRVQRSGDGISFGDAGTSPADATTFTDTGLSAGTTYWYRVLAFNGSGDSTYSNTDSATTDAGPAITQFASGADYYPAAAVTVAAALQRFPMEVSLLGLGVDLAIERSDTGAATAYMRRLPAGLAALAQWQFRAALVACLEGQAELAEIAFAKLLAAAQGSVSYRGGTWNGSVDTLSGLAQRPVPLNCRAAVRGSLSLLEP